MKTADYLIKSPRRKGKFNHTVLSINCDQNVTEIIPKKIEQMLEKICGVSLLFHFLSWNSGLKIKKVNRSILFYFQCLEANKCAIIMKDFVAGRKQKITLKFNKKTSISQQ